MIRAVLFDLDGTLFDRDSSVRRLVARQYEAFEDVLRPLDKSTFVERFMELDERGYVPKPEVYRGLLLQLGGSNVTPEALFGYWQAHFHDQCMLYPGAVETLDRLSADGLALGIITNGGFPWQLRTVQALGIEHYFRAILVSEAEGLRKPQAAIFERAVQRLGATAGETVFVGDHPSVDVDGASNAGLRAIWKREPYWPAPSAADAVIDELEDLPPLIRGL